MDNRLYCSGLFWLFLATCFGVGRASFAQVPHDAPPATRVAKIADTPQAFPNSLSFDFEEPSVTAAPGRFVRYGVRVSPFNFWRNWIMSGSAGIAVNGSSFTRQNQLAPKGQHVAFIQGTSSLSTIVVIGKGTWRLKFQGAQRMRRGGPDHQVIRVAMGQKQLGRFDFDNQNYASYVTQPFTLTVPATVPILIQGLNPGGGDNTALIDNVLIERLSEWDDPSTWEKGVVPQSFDHVLIPERSVVALKGKHNHCRTLQVLGHLQVGDVDTELKSNWVAVRGPSGLFQVGSLTTPFLKKFTLTLTAKNKQENFLGAGNKFLAALEGGTIHLHGQKKVAWTKLSVTAVLGDTQLSLSSPVNWNVGDEIIVAASNHQRSVDVGYPNYIDEAEHLKVASVSTNGMTVFLDIAANGAIKYRHFGGAPQTYSSPPTASHPSGQSWVLDQRAEVGLLSHNVKVQGSASSNRSRFGGHIMVKHSPIGIKEHSRGFVSHVELFRMGQEQILGRYPMHWHVMAENAKGQYIVGSSIHHTYNRAITIHGTDSLLVRRNVAYDNVGHAIFLEEGSEENNRIIGNLVINTVKPENGSELLPSDNELEQLQNRTPASFWITNPNNEIRNNVAAGTEGTGFWFIFPENVLGLSANNSYLKNRKPIENDLGVFDGNVAHGCGSGFDVEDSIDPTTDHIIKNVAWRPRSGGALLTNFTIYGCDMGLYSGVSEEDIVFSRIILADNNENIRLAAYHTVKDSVAIAQTGNSGVVLGGERGYVVYDGAARLEDCHFVGFDQSNTWAIYGSGAASLHANHSFRGMTFSHSTLPIVNFADFAASVNLVSGLPIGTYPAYCFDEQHDADPRLWGMALRDIDGSLWGVPGSTLIGNHPLMLDPTADITPAGLPPQNEALLTTHRYGHLQITHDGLGVGSIPDIWVKRQSVAPDPGSLISFQLCFQAIRAKQFPVIVDSHSFYTVTWPTPTGFNGIEVRLDDVELGDSVRLQLAGLAALGAMNVTNATEVFSLVGLWSTTTTSYMIFGNDIFIHFTNVSGQQTLHVTW